ncbi:MAG: HPF/RaiA family ribosome-associated protein [Candidatus Berkelbacteria bacterium]|nr:HPF/RaiA family ribosome-associated protein [Candidatus Berkelbacteria bacterium]
MQINIRTTGVIITARQKGQIEKNLTKLKKYLKNESPVKVDVQLIDDAGSEKNSTQTVKIDITSEHYSLHVEEKKNNVMKAFVRAFSATDRQLRDRHKKEIEKNQKTGGRFDKVFGILGKFRRKK